MARNKREFQNLLTLILLNKWLLSSFESETKEAKKKCEIKCAENIKVAFCIKT